MIERYNDIITLRQVTPPKPSHLVRLYGYSEEEEEKEEEEEEEDISLALYASPPIPPPHNLKPQTPQPIQHRHRSILHTLET